jgi:hypothetical protein
VLDVQKLTRAVALDLIGSAALGYDFDALGTESAYAQAIDQLWCLLLSSALVNSLFTHLLQAHHQQNPTDNAIPQAPLVSGTLLSQVMDYGHLLPVPR